MQRLFLPPFDPEITTLLGKSYIFDPLRKKKVKLTPEEWVRQHLTYYLTHYLGYPRTLIKVEASKRLAVSSYLRRADIVVYGKQQGKPLMLIECKAASHKLSSDALRQVTHYNTLFQAPFLTVTNGHHHISYRIDSSHKTYTMLTSIPPFQTLHS